MVGGHGMMITIVNDTRGKSSNANKNAKMRRSANESAKSVFKSRSANMRYSAGSRSSNSRRHSANLRCNVERKRGAGKRRSANSNSKRRSADSNNKRRNADRRSSVDSNGNSSNSRDSRDSNFLKHGDGVQEQARLLNAGATGR